MMKQTFSNSLNKYLLGYNIRLKSAIDLQDWD